MKSNDPKFDEMNERLGELILTIIDHPEKYRALGYKAGQLNPELATIAINITSLVCAQYGIKAQDFVEKGLLTETDVLDTLYFVMYVLDRFMEMKSESTV